MARSHGMSVRISVGSRRWSESSVDISLGLLRGLFVDGDRARQDGKDGTGQLQLRRKQRQLLRVGADRLEVVGGQGALQPCGKRAAQEPRVVGAIVVAWVLVRA